MTGRPLKHAIILVMAMAAGPGCDKQTDASFRHSLDAGTAARLLDVLHASPCDAFEVMQNGQSLVSWGDNRSKINVASVRKSIISALYGIAASRQLIDLDATLGELGISDRTYPLTPVEQQATVMDLLKARSGIYLPTIGESPGMIARKPGRGSARPGERFYYNNWDFNVLGTIFEKQTGISLGHAFDDWIARPLGMADFQPGDVHYEDDDVSGHRMYRFYLSARDLVRFGQLYVDAGRWEGRQVIPADWVATSLSRHSDVKDSPRADGYGLLWWLDSRAGLFLAEGSGGQFIVVDPARRQVMVLMNDTGFDLFGLRLHNPLAQELPYAEVQRLREILR